MNSLWGKKQFMYKAPHFLSLINFAQEYLIVPNLPVYHSISVNEKCKSQPETCH